MILLKIRRCIGNSSNNVFECNLAKTCTSEFFKDLIKIARVLLRRVQFEVFVKNSRVHMYVFPIIYYVNIHEKIMQSHACVHA